MRFGREKEVEGCSPREYCNSACLHQTPDGTGKKKYEVLNTREEK